VGVTGWLWCGSGSRGLGKTRWHALGEGTSLGEASRSSAGLREARWETTGFWQTTRIDVSRIL